MQASQSAVSLVCKLEEAELDRAFCKGGVEVEKVMFIST